MKFLIDKIILVFFIFIISPTDVLGKIAAAKIAGQELDRVLSNAIGQLDQATANRIRQLQAELETLIQ